MVLILNKDAMKKTFPSKPTQFFHEESSVNVVPQGYHSHVSSKLLSVRVIVNSIAQAQMTKNNSVN